MFTNDQEYKDNRSEIVRGDTEVQQPGQNNQNQGGPPQDQRQQLARPQSNKPEGGFVDELRVRIDQYFSLVLRTVKDSIPKVIGYFLVRKSQDSLMHELYNQINTNPAFTKQLGEPKMIQERRKALKTVLATMKNSLKVLQRDPDI